jgi:hypothetical protein
LELSSQIQLATIRGQSAAIKVISSFSLSPSSLDLELSSQIQLATIRGQSAAIKVISSFSLPFFAGFDTLSSQIQQSKNADLRFAIVIKKE